MYKDHQAAGMISAEPREESKKTHEMKKRQVIGLLGGMGIHGKYLKEDTPRAGW